MSISSNYTSISYVLTTTSNVSCASGASGASGSSGACGASGALGASNASGPLKSNETPIELKELLSKYQEQGCTKEEILTVLEKLGINSNINGNKIVFEYGGKKYSLAFSNPVNSTPSEVSNGGTSSIEQIYNDFIDNVNSELESLANELFALYKFTPSNCFINTSKYEEKFISVQAKIVRKIVEMKRNDMYIKEFADKLEKCMTGEGVFLDIAFSGVRGHNLAIQEVELGTLENQEIPFPDIANMTLEEINVALNKYNAGLNAIKGQIELINESVSVEQHSSGSVASRLLIKQRSEYQKLMVTIMDIVNTLQSQKELLKKIEE